MEPYLSFVPSRKGKAHVLVPLLLFIPGFTAMLTSVSQWQVRMPLQILCLVLVVAGIQITTRFALCFYEYAIFMSDNGDPFLRITKMQGKYRTVVCHSLLSSIIAVSNDKKPDFSQYGKKIPVYSFCVNMFTQNTMTILLDRSVNEISIVELSDLTKTDTIYAAISLEYDSEFYRALRIFTDIGEKKE